MLSERQYRFVIEYCKDPNGTRAAISVGYSERSAGSIACELLTKPEVHSAIESHKRDLAGAARVTAAFVSEKLRQIADSDRPRCCRYCWGIGHQYQWTQREYTRALNEALNAGKPVPDIQGGFGFSKKTEPNADCPECEGEGNLLGLPSEDKDRLKALDLLQKQLGVQTQNVQHSGPGGGPMSIATLDLNSLSDAQLEAMLPTDLLEKGTIEGTLSLPEPNSSGLNELEAGSSP